MQVLAREYEGCEHVLVGGHTLHCLAGVKQVGLMTHDHPNNLVDTSNVLTGVPLLNIVRASMQVVEAHALHHSRGGSTDHTVLLLG